MHTRFQLLLCVLACRGPALRYMTKEPQTKVQLRIKAATPIVTGLALAALLLNDWGEGNVFSGIRPAVRSALNRLYGTQSPPPDSKRSRSI